MTNRPHGLYLQVLHDIQQNDTQHKDIQHYDTYQKDIKSPDEVLMSWQ